MFSTVVDQYFCNELYFVGNLICSRFITKYIKKYVLMCYWKLMKVSVLIEGNVLMEADVLVQVMFLLQPSIGGTET